MNKTITTRFNSLIEKKVGLPIASIRRMCSDEITQHIEENKHVSLKLSNSNDGLSNAAQYARDQTKTNYKFAFISAIIGTVLGAIVTLLLNNM